MNINMKVRRALVLALAIVLLMFCFNYKSYNELSNFILTRTSETVEHIRKLQFPRKWIVVTSIHKPTEAIRAFSRMPGWQLLVVGDKKTPNEWSLENTIYLGVEEQKQLSYSIMKHIPWNTYARKMIGYLYAIQHGAEFIYESDDDNVPSMNLSFYHQDHPYRLVAETKDFTFNPYAHFGQSSVWPRGYPLDRIGMPHPSMYVSCPTETPTIIQFLVNGDPDVDAIYRLTRLSSTIKLDIIFDPKAPLYLNPSGTFSPFNSQNTLFSRNAFWGLLLPLSVTNRATDIFRSYWAQRLMWLLGQHLAFGPASFYQRRSDHTYLNDFEEEVALYKEVGNFIKVLKYWNCKSNIFEECILDLTRVVTDGGFWKEEDYKLVQAWISDLKYIDKSLLNFELARKDACIDGRKNFMVFHPDEQTTSINRISRNVLFPYLSNNEAMEEMIYQHCGLLALERWKLSRFKSSSMNVALVVSVHGNVESSLPSYETLYRSHFHKIIYCVDKSISEAFLEKWKATVMFLKAEELSAVSCLTSASLINLNVTGFLHLSDNMHMNVTFEWKERDFERIWMPEKQISKYNFINMLCINGTNHCKNLSINTFNRILSKISTNLTSHRIEILKHKMERMQILSKSNKLMMMDIPIYLPKSKALQWYQIKSVFTSKSTVSTKFLTWLFLEWHGANVSKLKNNMSTDTYFHPDMKTISSLNKDFCRYF